mgnify:CR=1 FL=1
MEKLVESSSQKLKCIWETLYKKTGDDAVIQASLSTLRLRKLGKGLVACFNPEISKKPLAQIRVDSTSATTTATETKHSISVPFDESKWNYTKVKEAQIIACYNQKTQRLILSGDDEFNSLTREAKEESCWLVVTPYPFVRYHTVIVPSPNLKLPQVFREDCFLEVLRIFSQFDSKEFW